MVTRRERGSSWRARVREQLFVLGTQRNEARLSESCSHVRVRETVSVPLFAHGMCVVCERGCLFVGAGRQLRSARAPHNWWRVRVHCRLLREGNEVCQVKRCERVRRVSEMQGRAVAARVCELCEQKYRFAAKPITQRPAQRGQRPPPTEPEKAPCEALAPRARAQARGRRVRRARGARRRRWRR